VDGAQPRPATGSTSSLAAAAADQVLASRQAELVAQALRAEHSDRANRLQRLHAEISAGQYAVDAREVSGRLIEEALSGNGIR
jgi:anti-sigma28 factor (negative regulator of flagellin synthesis)